MNTKTKGYILGAIAAATYGLNPLFTLPLYEIGMNPDSVLFFRYLLALPILALMIKLRGRSFKMKGEELITSVVVGLLFAISSLTLFQSYNYMDAGIASTILFIYPIIVTLIMFFFFKEKITIKTAICVIMATLGIGLLYKTSDGATLSAQGVILVLVSALSYALYIVSINKSALKDTPTLKVIFFVLLFGMSLYAVRLLLNQNLTLPDKEHWYLWGNILCLSIFPTAISLMCTTKAISYIGSTPTAILGALEPVTAVIIGVSIFHEAISFRILCGLVLIVAAVTIIIAGGGVTSFFVRLRKMFPRIPQRKGQKCTKK